MPPRPLGQQRGTAVLVVGHRGDRLEEASGGLGDVVDLRHARHACHPPPGAGLGRPLPWRTRVRTTPTPDTISRRPSKDSSGGPAHHPGGPGAQPQGRVARPPARRTDRLHRALRLGQVVPRLRHHLRRGAATLRRVALGVRPPVPRPDGQARRRLHRGALTGGLDRPEVHVEEPPLDGRHHHRGLRLPPAPLRPRRAPALPHLRVPDRAADAAADRRQGAVPRGGAALPGAGPGDPRPQGRVPRAVPPAPGSGVLPGPGQRRDPHARRPAQARQAEEAHDRGRGRPAGREGHRQAPAHRLGRDRPQPRRRPGAARLRRPRRLGPRPRAAVLRADGVPQRAPHRHRRARAPLVLVQLALRRLLGLQRARHPDGGRPRAGRPRPQRHARRGSPPALERRPRRRLLPQADGRARRRARLRPRHPLARHLAARPEVAAQRPLDQGPRRHPQPLRPRARLLGAVRGRPHVGGAQAPRVRVRHDARALRGLHARGAVPRLPRQPAEAGLDGGHPRRPQHRRGLRPPDQRDRRLPPRPRPLGPRAADRGAGAQGDPGAAAVPARRGARLPLPRPPLGVAVRAARPSGSAWPRRSAPAWSASSTSSTSPRSGCTSATTSG